MVGMSQAPCDLNLGLWTKPGRDGEDPRGGEMWGSREPHRKGRGIWDQGGEMRLGRNFL